MNNPGLADSEFDHLSKVNLVYAISGSPCILCTKRLSELFVLRLLFMCKEIEERNTKIVLQLKNIFLQVFSFISCSIW